MKTNNGYVLKCDSLSVFYGDRLAVRNISLNMQKGRIMALMGPSGCGKSTLLRCFNRMNDFVPNCRVTGQILLNDREVSSYTPEELRLRAGMLFQRPYPFAKSIRENILWALRLHKKDASDAALEKWLRAAALWDEVKDKLDAPASTLSGGQAQRLCLARALALEPEVLLLDEPCSALDPLATAQIEELLKSLKSEVALVLVTHSLAQARRVADDVAFLWSGDLIEYGLSSQVFIDPKEKRTREFVQGVWG